MPDTNERHIHDTCDVCDSPQACLAGDCPCQLSGTFLAGPREGKTPEECAQLHVAVRWPMPTEAFIEQNPVFSSVCLGVVELLSKKGTVTDEEFNDRAEILQNAAIKAYDTMQETVMTLTGDGKVSLDGMWAAAALVGAVMQHFYAAVMGPNAGNPKARYIRNQLFAAYMLTLQDGLATPARVEATEAEMPAPEKAPDLAADLARRLAGG